MGLGYKVHTVGSGDTIQALGTLYDVPWEHIAIVNALSYPYICTEPNLDDDDKLPSDVATIGTVLVIPTGAFGMPIEVTGSADDIAKAMLGTDLDIYGYDESENNVIRIGDDGELYDIGRGDLYLAEGIRNVRQQLITRLATPKGTLLLHPEYGSDILKYVGKRQSHELIFMIEMCVREAILLDARVAGVHEVNITVSDSSILLDCIIELIDPFGTMRLNHEFTYHPVPE